MKILVFNPGGNSLKAEIIQLSAGQRRASEGRELASVSVEGIGKEPKIAVLEGKRTISSEPVAAESYGEAARSILDRWAAGTNSPALSGLDAIAVRVVHGASEFDRPARIDDQVVGKIRMYGRLAPLHSQGSIDVIEALRQRFPGISMYAVFDTAFHRTIPPHASTYPIPQELAEKHQIRRYGFHGISHRYLAGRYAELVGREPEEVSVVSLHLESGCSVTAVRKGLSVDNTMGLTPLEGLMMGTRSGDIDPSVVALLVEDAQMTVAEAMTLLNRSSGLLGVSEKSLDTRVLMKEYDSDPRVKLAMDMFAYRIRKAVGGYLAALGSADAVVFGGGIGENGVFVRKTVSDGLAGFGLDLDEEANRRLIDCEGRLSTPGSRLEAWVIPTEEGLEMAHECSMAVREE